MLQQELAGPDFLKLVRTHLSEARGGDGEAQLLLALALQTCARIEADDLAPGSELRAALGNPAAKADQRELASGFSRLCDPLTSASAETGTADYWRDLAAEQGVGVALLMRAEDPERSADQRLADFHRALSTADPAVVMQLVFTGPNVQHSGDTESSAKIDSAATAAALDLVQCRLGYDCTPTGEVYQGLFCSSASRNCQHADDVSRYYELNMNPQRFAEVDEYAARLVSNLRSCGDSWPEAQAVERKFVQAGNNSGGQDRPAE